MQSVNQKENVLMSGTTEAKVLQVCLQYSTSWNFQIYGNIGDIWCKLWPQI